jgi:hypothetical protein
MVAKLYADGRSDDCNEWEVCSRLQQCCVNAGGGLTVEINYLIDYDNYVQTEEKDMMAAACVMCPMPKHRPLKVRMPRLIGQCGMTGNHTT